MKSILIIDDSLMDRKLLMSVLKRSGFANDILQAGDGADGLRILSGRYQDVGLIFVDWQMPKMDGIDFMKSVRQVPETARIPIIMITASGSDSDKQYAREVNPDLAGYFVKPYKPDTLVKTVRPYLEEG